MTKVSINPSALYAYPLQLATSNPKQRADLLYTSTAMDQFQSQQLKQGQPFTELQAKDYVKRVWQRSGYAVMGIPAPTVMFTQAGETPFYGGGFSIPFDQWVSMKPKELIPQGSKITAFEDGALKITLTNTIVIPKEVMDKGILAILAHEMQHALMYPPIVAATLAGKVSPRPGESIDPLYINAIKQAGLDLSPTVVNEGVYRTKLLAGAAAGGPALIAASQKLEGLETRGQVNTPEHSQALQAYKAAMAHYFGTPEELKGFILYSQLKGDTELMDIFNQIAISLSQRNSSGFSQSIDRLAAKGIAEGHLKPRPNIPPLDQKVIQELFSEWDINQQLLAEMPFDYSVYPTKEIPVLSS